ncbi:MAG: hypothetical protein LBE37_12850 [Sphingobacterium sp.]|jgi:hypothetical protein|nr:hypothetical protein [Sphingobacterium sp.]
MRTTMKIIKTGLLALFLSTMAFGQETKTPLPGPISPLGPQNTTTAGTTSRGNLFDPVISNFDDELGKAILFFNPSQANSITLKASKIEDESKDRKLEFTKYIWSESTDGTTYTEITAQTTATLNQSGLTPGYHYYKVKGIINPDGADESLLCQAKEETFVVFVLPPLSVTANRADNGTGFLQYCESDAATQTNVVLKANAAYTSYLGTPALADFQLKYNWYAVKAGADGTFPTEPTLENIGSLTPVATNLVTSNSNNLTPSIAEVGKYKFFVEVEYTIKDRTYDGAETANARKRTYALYRGWVGGTNQATATEVFVTPAPGKPHITIQSVTD